MMFASSQAAAVGKLMGCTMQSKKESSALKVVVTLIWAFGSAISSANAQQDFIVTGDKIINSHVQQEYVRLSERIPISQLKRRFARYKITSTAGEDCLVCATVSRNSFQFEVNYDEELAFGGDRLALLELSVEDSAYGQSYAQCASRTA
jgi:hypothetical protein